MDISSELAHSLLPLLLVSVVGATTVTVGLIEGVAESTASIATVPMVTLAMNLVYSAVSTLPAFSLSEIGRRAVLVAAVAVLVAADLVLAFAPGLVGLFIGVGLWGAYMGLARQNTNPSAQIPRGRSRRAVEMARAWSAIPASPSLRGIWSAGIQRTSAAVIRVNDAFLRIHLVGECPQGGVTGLKYFVRLLHPRAWETVARLDLGKPGRKLVEVVFELLKLRERELPALSFLFDLGEKFD